MRSVGAWLPAFKQAEASFGLEVDQVRRSQRSGGRSLITHVTNLYSGAGSLITHFTNMYSGARSLITHVTIVYSGAGSLITHFTNVQ